MKFTGPQTLQSEHEALHERLRQATEAGGEALNKLREAARRARHDDIVARAVALA